MEMPVKAVDKPSMSKRRSLLADFLIRLLREKPLGTLGFVIVFLMLFTAIFTDYWHLTVITI